MKDRGFSLIEMMMAIALIAILSLIGGAGFVAAAARQQGRTVATELAAELRMARHLAMSRREAVRVTFSDEMSSMRIKRANTPEEVLRHFDFHDRKVTVDSLSNGPSITFYPSGRAATPTTIVIRNARQQHWRLTVSITGRITLL